MSVYYGDNDPAICEWVRELIRQGLIPPGDVDCRPIQEVCADDVRGYDQVHLFCGISGWAYALELAGWADRPVWTGSCPCQPYSNAGRRQADDDPRNLWPEMRRLIEECRPVTVFGEQVASKAGREWLAGVRADLDVLGYAFGAADLCAAGVGAPHIRQRLWWVADSDGAGRETHRGHDERAWERQQGVERVIGTDSVGGRLGDPHDTGPQGRIVHAERAGECAAGEAGVAGGVADAERQPVRQRGSDPQAAKEVSGKVREQRIRTDAKSSCRDWSGAIWLPCGDGKARRIEPGIEPLVDGFPARVDLLRGYGNAINPQTAAAFVKAYMEAA